ncbi:hypothetical protein ACROYT_G032053 [Oculina patagonica]
MEVLSTCLRHRCRLQLIFDCIRMKKFTASVVILAFIVLIQKIDPTEGFARGGCMQPMHRGSGGMAAGNKPRQGTSP